MKQDEAESLARRMRPGNAILENAWPTVNAGDLRRLCDHILSGDMRREIENAAYERVTSVKAIAALHTSDRASARHAIRALIQPPAQKDEGK